MAKRTNKMKKKRFKKQLSKQQKTLIKQEAVKVPLSKDELYQRELDKMYGGSVVPLERYINAKATLIHKCTECGKEFYCKPGWIIVKANQKHVCGVDSGKKSKNKKSVV